ncbi:MAG: hypothetical protein L7S65_03130 [Schleiferiaceae bacterium]|nr:hypothetical protein [Schleiferiaceae bacterium]
MEDSQTPEITNHHSDVSTDAFPVDDYIIGVDPVDLIAEEDYTSKPQSQSNSKHAFPFGAQISTPCTYGVF